MQLVKSLEKIGQSFSLNQFSSVDELLKASEIENNTILLNQAAGNDQFCGLLPTDDEDGGEEGGDDSEE